MPKDQVIRKTALIPTALISGGAGFIGSHLAQALLDKGARVIALDNFQTGKQVNIQHLMNNPNFALYDVDINEGIPSDIDSVDYIIHLASLEEYLYSKEYLNLDSLLTNSLGVKNLLDLAKKSEAKFLLASTIDVYQGRMSQLSIDKYFGFSSFEDNKFSLTEAKRFSEALVWQYYHRYKLDIRVARLPEIYGPNMNLDASGSIGSFLKDLIERRDISVRGDGTDKEFYLYIEDAIAGILKALFNPVTKGNIYSLVGGEPVSVLEVAYLVKSMADAELDVKYSPYLSPVKQGPRDVDTFNLGDLAWEPKVALKEGIVKTLSWFGYKVNSLSFKPARYIQDHIASRAVTAPPIATTPMPIYAYEPGFKAPAANVPTSFSPNPYPYINKRNPVGELIKKLRDIVRKGIKTTGALPRITAHSVSPKVSRSLTIGAILAAAVITFVVFPVFQVFSKAEHGKLALMAVRDPSNHFDSEQIKNNLKTATEDFTSSRSYLVKVKWLFKISGKKEQYNATYRLLSSLINFSKSGEELADVVKPMEALWAIIRPDTDETMDSSYFDSAKFSLLNARNTIGLASADFKNISIPDLPEKLQEPARVYGVYLEQIDSGLVLASAVVADLPQILGASSKKTYMVWFQNSNEIRPTGGFIGSYGLLTFENGKLKDLTIDDIYNPDGQIDLRGISVPSPSPIAELLGENGLHLRNSNWSPDFPSSVVAFDDLYYRVTGEDIDGYLAVDLSFAKELINVTGPLFLAAYDEQITSENLYERTQYHSDFNFEAGSDAKRGFLTVLGSKLLEKIFATPKDKISPLLGSIEKSLDERHFQIYFKNSSLNAFLKSRNWDGSLADSEGDYLQVVNANLGGTKANYYVQNTMEYEVDSLTRDGILRGTLALNYKHTGEGDAWPGGPYTNYVRVLTQAGSKLTGAKFIYKDNTTLDIFDRIRVSSVGRYSSFETTFKLEPTSSLTLLLNYDLPEGLSITKDFQDYTMLWQKQSGTHDDVFNFKFNAPFGMTLNQFSSNLEQKNNLVEDTGVLDKDVRYIVKLQ